MKSFYIYTRCSTAEQSKKGHSHDYQIKALRDHHKTREWYEVGVFSDTISGSTFIRDQLDILRKLCYQDPTHVDYILVQRWDRFGRDVGDAFSTLKDFHNLGVEINCPDQWLDFKDANWPVFLGIYISTAHSERLKISERTKNGLYQAVISGYYPHSAPTGYKKEYEGERKILVPDDKAEYVRMSFEQVAEGESAQEAFNNLGKYLEIKRSTFYRMLSNPVYRGVVPVWKYKHYEAHEVPGRHEAIVSDAIWFEVQERMKSTPSAVRGKKWKLDSSLCNELFLKGCIRGKFGNYMVSYYSRGKSGRRYGYYGSPKAKHIVPAKKAHDLIESFFESARIDDSLLSEMSDVRAEMIAPLESHIEHIDAKIDKLEKRKDRIRKDYMNEIITAKEYTSFVNEIRKEVAIFVKDRVKLEKQIRSFPVVNRRLLRMIEPHSIYKKGTLALKNQLVRATFPLGFTIIKSRLGVFEVRTPHINHVVHVTDRESMTYEFENEKRDKKFQSCPVRGERRDSNPRPPEPQSGALTS